MIHQTTKFITVISIIILYYGISYGRQDLSLLNKISNNTILSSFAVSGFSVIGENSEAYSWLGVGLGDDLSTRLSNCKGTLIELERLKFNDVLKAANDDMLTQKVSWDETLNFEEKVRLLGINKKAKYGADKIGTVWAARYIIVGSLWIDGLYGSEDCLLHVNVRIVDVKTSEIISGITIESSGTYFGFIKLQENLAINIAKKLGVSEAERLRIQTYKIDVGDTYKNYRVDA